MKVKMVPLYSTLAAVHLTKIFVQLYGLVLIMTQSWTKAEPCYRLTLSALPHGFVALFVVSNVMMAVLKLRPSARAVHERPSVALCMA